jgi:ketosteroid isomerase-like protein
MTSSHSDPIVQKLLELENAALVRWCNGDPSGFLEISAPDVVYFDPFIEQRIDGLASLSQYYESIRGKVAADRFEILNPAVQRSSDLAVLTFNFVSYGANKFELRWNCTEVYRREAAGWRIIQTHWSFTAPQKVVG